MNSQLHHSQKLTDNAAERHFVFVMASSRHGGNSEQLARLAASSLDASVKQTWISLADVELDDFLDQRHDGDGTYPMPQNGAARLLEATMDATDLVFVTPLYWYSLPTLAKRYLDHWSAWMRVPNLAFRERMAGKRFWNITVSADEDQSFAEPLIRSLQHTANYMQMVWQGSLVGYGNRPGDVMEHEESLQSARLYFNAKAARR